MGVSSARKTSAGKRGRAASARVNSPISSTARNRKTLGFMGRAASRLTDHKLSDRRGWRGWRGPCVVGERRRPEAASVTAGAVRDSAYGLGVAVVFMEGTTGE